jgi:DNA mismatch repair ATPase MutL
VEHHNGAKVEFKVKILGTCVGDALLRQCMEAVAIRDDRPTMNKREEWGTRKNNNPKIKPKKQQNENTGTTFQVPQDHRKNSKEKVPNPVTAKPQIRKPATANKKSNKRANKKTSRGDNDSAKGTKNDDVENKAIQKSDEEENEKESNNNTVCWKCKVVCKTNRGLKIHQHACLQKAAGGTSFFRDERLELNQHRNERREFCGMKILPPSQTLEPLISGKKYEQSDVK